MAIFEKIFPPENVALDLDISSKKRAFEQAGLLFENNCGIARALVSDSLLARERLGSTALGYGTALPHCRIKGIKQPIAAFVRLKQAIPFEAPDGLPVHLMLFLLLPNSVTQHHLDILAHIAEMFSEQPQRDWLGSAWNAAEVHQRLLNWRPSGLDVILPATPHIATSARP